MYVRDKDGFVCFDFKAPEALLPSRKIWKNPKPLNDEIRLPTKLYLFGELTLNNAPINDLEILFFDFIIARGSKGQVWQFKHAVTIIALR